MDEEGKILPEGNIGCIQIKGDNVTKGYHQREEYSNNIINKEGWLSTGDIGVQVNGDLLITGRHKDIIIVNGLNYYANDIEELCEKHLQINPGRIVACSLPKTNTQEEELGIFIVDAGKDLETFKIKAKGIRTFLARTLNLEVKYIILIVKLPKTTSGKVQRYKIVEQYKNHKFDVETKTLYPQKIVDKKGHFL